MLMREKFDFELDPIIAAVRTKEDYAAALKSDVKCIFLLKTSFKGNFQAFYRIKIQKK